MAFMDGLEFLTDQNLDSQVKAMLLQGVLEDRRFMRDAVERKRWWQNSPVVLAIVGIISVFASGCVAYIQAGRTASDTLTLTQLKAQLDTQTAVLTQQHEDSKGMQDFEYRIFEKLVDKTVAERATVLLSVQRAGIVHGLNVVELADMAKPLAIEGSASQIK
jgi:hypothetical protein